MIHFRVGDPHKRGVFQMWVVTLCGQSVFCMDAAPDYWRVTCPDCRKIADELTQAFEGENDVPPAA